MVSKAQLIIESLINVLFAKITKEISSMSI